MHGGGDDDVGQLRQVVGQLFHAEVARQVLRQALEQLCVVHFTQDIHLPLRVAGRVVELALQVQRQRGRIGHRVADAFVQQFIEQDRVLREEGGGPAAGAHHAHHAFQRVRVLCQQ